LVELAFGQVPRLARDDKRGAKGFVIIGAFDSGAQKKRACAQDDRGEGFEVDDEREAH
jgi:hypothetical protein